MDSCGELETLMTINNAKQGLYILRAEKEEDPKLRCRYKNVVEESLRFVIFDLPDILQAHHDIVFARLVERRRTS